jgi:ABC-type dipeptide/oligopeptide/nickel transport system permease subunit
MSRKILWNRIKHSPQFMTGGIIVILLFIIAIFSKQLAPFDWNLTNTSIHLKPPGFNDGTGVHILGTDQLGRDIFSRLLVGSSYSLFVSVVSTFCIALIGTSLGIVAGYKGGWLDNFIMRCTEISMAVPTLTLGVVIMSVFGTGIVNLIVVMIVGGWISFARIARNNVFLIKNREFVQASKALGGTNFYIMWKQIFPNITTPLIIQASAQFGSVILVESSLSYLNLGIQAPNPSWGNMISECRNFMAVAPWTVVAPGVALMIAVLGFNLLGDGLRDVLDPKQSR